VHEPCVSNEWSIGFKSRLFAGHLSFCTLFATLITNVILATWHYAWSRANIIPRVVRISRKRTDRMTSFRYPIAVMFPWMVTLGAFVCMNTIERVLLCLFSPYLMFVIIYNRRGILFYQIRQLPWRGARGARAHNLCSHLPFSTVLYVKTFSFFPLIDRLMSTIQSNQTLDALIKYVA